MYLTTENAEVTEKNWGEQYSERRHLNGFPSGVMKGKAVRRPYRSQRALATPWSACASWGTEK